MFNILKAKYVIKNIMDNSYICYVSDKVIRETDYYPKASSFSKKDALKIVSNLQQNCEFVKYKLELI